MRWRLVATVGVVQRDVEMAVVPTGDVMQLAVEMAFVRYY